MVRNDNMSSDPQTIIITGGGGFVGSYLQQELKKSWPKAKVVSWDLPEVDITKTETYKAQLAELAPDWVVHLAAIASVPAAIKNPDLAHEVNTEGTRKLIKAIQSESPGTKMLFVSTADIYGTAAKTYDGVPMTELDVSECEPANPYAQSKLGAEKIVQELMPDAAIRVRPFPHIGAGQAVGFVSSDFASQIAAIERGQQDPVMRVGNLEAQRDFTDVHDVARAYRLLMEKGKLGEVYHVASGKPTAIKDLLHTLLAMSDADIEVVQDVERMRPADIEVLVGDATKLQKISGWQPKIPLKKSLQDVLAWWRKTQEEQS